MKVTIDGTWTPMHTGFIVRDLEKGVGHFESLGFTFQPRVDRDTSQIADYQVRGQKRTGAEKWSLRLAAVGAHRIELVCPTQGDTLFAECLREKGEGIHHVAFSVPDLVAERNRLMGMGVPEIMRFIRADGTGASFFDLQKDGGFIVELVQAQQPQ